MCEYRCVWNYNFETGVIADRMDAIREPAHYIYEQYGAGCTGFNLRPLENGNKVCEVCADINFNPIECFSSGVNKDPDCITRCNMLPNCTSVCTAVLLNSPQYASETAEKVRAPEFQPQQSNANGSIDPMCRGRLCARLSICFAASDHARRLGEKTIQNDGLFRMMDDSEYGRQAFRCFFCGCHAVPSLGRPEP